MTELQQKLKAAFDVSTPWNRKGVAHISVVTRDEDGQRYIGCNIVIEEKLKGRSYKIWEDFQGKLGIDLLDATFNRESWSYPNPVHRIR